MGGPWYDEARVIRSAGYLSKETSAYQEFILAGMHIYDEMAEIDKYNEFIETMFALIQPNSFNKYKKKKDLQRSEEGVDTVIYKGEDNWEEIMEEFGEYGFTNLDLYGETLNDA